MLVHQPKKALVLKLREPERVTTLIPMAKTIDYKGERFVALPHTIDVVKVLRNIGMHSAPAPILHYYKWLGKHTPFAAQRSTAGFLTLHSRAFVLNEIGTGKTNAVMWAYDYLRSIKRRNKMLVVSPLSTLERTWGDTIFEGFPHLNYAVLHGTRGRRLKLLEQDVDIYVINHDGVEVIQEALKSRPDIDLVVIDEVSQAARNATTKRWKVLNQVINGAITRDCWALTGTPLPNSPMDAFAQCKLLVPERVPKYVNRFRDSVMRQVNQFTWVPRDNALDTVREAMQPSIRFTRDQCVDLPPCMYETRDVELSPEQTKAYKDMLNNLHTEYGDGQITAVNEAVKMSKLIQICCGGAFGTNGEQISIPSPSRLAAVYDIVEQNLAKVIVFVPFVATVQTVADYLLGKGLTVEFIHGGVTPPERNRILKAFQKTANPRVLVAQPGTLSHGLTLTEANTIVWFAPITSNDIATQAEGRITRPGQKNNQFIIQLAATPLEHKMYDRLKKKQQVQGLLLEMMKDEAAKH